MFQNDPFRQGVDIYVGRTGQVLFPISALLNYLVARGNKEGLLFHFSDGSLFTKSKFVDKIRVLLYLAGFEASSYAGHSFRICAASTAAANGVEDSLIQTLGRWKSSAYLTYIRLPAKNVAATLYFALLCRNNNQRIIYNTADTIRSKIMSCTMGAVRPTGHYLVPSSPAVPPLYMIGACTQGRGHQGSCVGSQIISLVPRPHPLARKRVWCIWAESLSLTVVDCVIEMHFGSN